MTNGSDDSPDIRSVQGIKTMNLFLVIFLSFVLLPILLRIEGISAIFSLQDCDKKDVNQLLSGARQSDEHKKNCTETIK